MQRLLVAIVTAVSLICGVTTADAEKRIALVIGNGAYEQLRKLSNPPNDARDLSVALEKLGFEVDTGIDLRLSEMQRKVTEFARRAPTADVALVFFAGHGVQAPDPLGGSQPVNYLLPIDVDIKDAADLGFQMTARDIVARLQQTSGIKLLILDACRDNPIPQRLAAGRGGGAPRGLGPEQKAAGTLIAFSTQPNEIADDGVERNSPFVKALLRHIAEPGLDVRLLFADVRRDVIRDSKGLQRPQTIDDLDGRFAFEAAKPTEPAAVVSPKPPVQGVGSLALAPVVPQARVEPPAAVAPQVRVEPPAKVEPPVQPRAGDMVAAADPAIQNLDQAIAANPDDATALSKRGQLYVLRGNFPFAIRDFDEVLRLRPKDPEALDNRCWARAIQGDLQAALRDCNEALQIRPRYADAYDSRGFIYLKIGQSINAIADYDAALRINPKQASSLYGRGMAKLKAGNSADAARDIAAAKALQANIAEEFAGFGIR